MAKFTFPTHLFKKKEVDRQHNKSYIYKMDDLTLSFNLRVDTKENIEGYLQLMERAVADLNEDLERLCPAPSE